MTNEKFWVTIDLGALRRNIRHVQHHIGEGRRVLFVVKSDGYGHGAVEITRAALAEGISSFGVATLAEGCALRKAGIAEDIILLQPSLESELEEVIAAKLQPSLSDWDTAERLSALALGRPVKVHIELNTGMNRMGFAPEEAISIVPRIAQLPHLTIEGIYTHFRPVAGNAHTVIREQLTRFNDTVTALRDQGVYIPSLHAASSISVLHYPESFFDTVRPGLLLYGGFNGDTPPGGPQTEPLMSCRCRVLYVRRIQAGEWIHYGDVFQAPRAMTVAVIAAGYGAGYPRSLSGQGEVLIGGRRAPICGVVGMDMTIVDVSDIPDCHTGDEVVLLGEDGDDEITVTELARKAGTIPYEITCRLGRNLPREYLHPSIRPGETPNIRESVISS